jgi:hypothetical protein
MNANQTTVPTSIRANEERVSKTASLAPIIRRKTTTTEKIMGHPSQTLNGLSI